MPLGLMGTKSGPVGGPCLPSPNHHGVSNRGPPRDHPDVPWCQEQGWDQQDTPGSQPVPCAWCGAGSGPKNEGGGCCCWQALPDPTGTGAGPGTRAAHGALSLPVPPQGPAPRGQPEPCLAISGQNTAELGLGSCCPAPHCLWDGVTPKIPLIPALKQLEKGIISAHFN